MGSSEKGPGGRQSVKAVQRGWVLWNENVWNNYSRYNTGQTTSPDIHVKTLGWTPSNDSSYRNSSSGPDETDATLRRICDASNHECQLCTTITREHQQLIKLQLKTDKPYVKTN